MKVCCHLLFSILPQKSLKNHLYVSALTGYEILSNQRQISANRINDWNQDFLVCLGENIGFFKPCLLEHLYCRCIQCKGSRYPATLPRPAPTVLPFQVPLCELNTEKSQYEVMTVITSSIVSVPQ